MRTSILDQQMCPRCGSDANEWVIQSRSFCIRCADCQCGIMATTWEPLFAGWKARVRLYRDGDESGTPVLEGVAGELQEQILKLTSGGRALILRVGE